MIQENCTNLTCSVEAGTKLLLEAKDNLQKALELFEKTGMAEKVKRTKVLLENV